VQNEGQKFPSIQFINPHAVRYGASVKISTNIRIHKYSCDTFTQKEKANLIGIISQLPIKIFTSSNKVSIQKGVSIF